MPSRRTLRTMTHREDAIRRLYSIDLMKLDDMVVARNLLIHLKDQLQNRYQFLVGEWANAHRARETRRGHFVTNRTVVRFLNSDS